MKKSVSLVLALVLALCLLAGCSGGQNAGADSTFTFAVNGDVDDFNPYTNQQIAYVYFFTFNCYEPLFHLNADMEYEMDLAESYKQVDELTYTFKLREGVTFHNGEKFTAEDVIHTIKYVANPDNGSYKQPSFANVVDVTASDDYNLTIKLSNPTPAFLDSLAWLPITCKSVEATDQTTKPVGTGAFKFESWTPNDSIKLTKYEKYWDVNRIHFENVVIKPYSDYSLAVNSLYAGDLDYISGLPVEHAETLDTTKGAKLISAQTSNLMYLFEVGLHNVPEFQDGNVMKAMNLVLDKAAINEHVFSGLGKEATSVLPSGAKYVEAVNTDGYDLEEAKALMAKSNYPNGFEFDVMVLNSDAASEMACVIWKQELAKIGITMNIQLSEMSVWLDAYLGRTYDMICNYYSMVGSDPATFCTVILAPYVDYQCKDMPELYQHISAGAETADETARQAAYSAIQKIVAEACPVISYVEAPQLGAAVEELEGITINGMAHIFLKDAAKN